MDDHKDILDRANPRHRMTHVNGERAEKKGLYLLQIDGGTKASAAGEMGEGAIGALLKEPNGAAIPGAELSERIGPVEGPTTAEYRALLRGLELARERDVNYLAVFSDSRNLVNQMNRLWKAGDNLAKLRDEAEEALRKFKGTQVSWVPGTGTRKPTRS